MKVFISFLTCPQCRTENREIAKYCKECGRELSQNVVSEHELKIFLDSNLYEERELTQQEVERIKQRVNEWSNSIPHHNLTNLADKIQITQVKEIPYYEVIISSLYEQRNFFTETTPCYKEYKTSIDFTKSVDINHINLWNNKIVFTRKEFKETTNIYPVDGTYEIERCYHCNGLGEVKCYECNGRGIVTCSYCRGKGTVICSSCNGTGKVRCSSWRCEHGRVRCNRCDGRGVVRKSEYISSGEYRTVSVPCEYCRGAGYTPCDTCNGTGYVVCSRCDGSGMVEDTHCDGKGVVQCIVCDGDGIIPCSTCDSTGELLSYYAIKQEFKILSQNIQPEELTYDIAVFEDKNLCWGEKFVKVFKEQKLPVVELNYDSLSVAEKMLQNTIQHKVIKEKVISTIKNIKTTDTNSGNFIAVKIQINKLPVYRMEYKFQNKDYVLYLFGSDISNTSISSETDPIKEFLQTLIQKFKTEIENSNFTHAWELFSKIEDITVDKDDIFSLAKMFIDTYTKTKFEQLKQHSYISITEFFISEVRNYLEKIKTSAVFIKTAVNIFETYCTPYIDEELKNNHMGGLIKFVKCIYTHLKKTLDEQKFKLFINTEVFRDTAEKIFSTFLKNDNLLYAVKLVKLLNPEFEQKIKTDELVNSINKKWNFVIKFVWITVPLLTIFCLLTSYLRPFLPFYILFFSFPFLSSSILYSKKIKLYLWTLLSTAIVIYLFYVSSGEYSFLGKQIMKILSLPAYIMSFTNYTNVTLMTALFFIIVYIIANTAHKELIQELKV